MNSQTGVLNDARHIHQREMWFDGLTSTFASQGNQAVLALNGVYGNAQINPYDEPERWVNEALNSLVTKVDSLYDSLVFRPLCLEFGPYGVHFLDKILGCRVYWDDYSSQWYNDYLTSPVGGLQYPELEGDDTWELAKRIAEAFVASQVALPLFGLPTLSSALNTAVNLYGQEVLIALHTDPEAAAHDLSIITELICDLHKWYLDHIPVDQLQPVVAGHRTQPRKMGQICGCTTQLVSPEMYRRRLAPLDEKVLSVYPGGGMIHLCGSHTQHISVWREMECLRAIQIQDRAALDLEAYYQGLRDDQIIYLNIFQDMTAERAMEITGGNRLVVVGDIHEPLTIRGNER